MSDFLTREELIAPARRRYHVLPIPELGNKKVRIQSLTAAERIEFRRQFNTGDDEADKELILQANEYACIATVVDQNGRLMLTPEDIDFIKGQDAAAISRIADAAMKMSRLGKHEDSEELLGNSEGTSDTNGKSGTSPSTANDQTGSAA